jgi:hypothetical protein
MSKMSKTKKTSRPSLLRPCDLLVHSVIAVLGCDAGTTTDATKAAEALVDSLDYEERSTLRRLSSAISSTLVHMSALERSSAICELASEPQAELRLIAALGLQSSEPMIGFYWCIETLAIDDSELVRNACSFAVAERAESAEDSPQPLSPAPGRRVSGRGDA